MLRELLALREKHHWNEQPYIAAAINSLAKAVEQHGDHAEADSLFETALAMRRRLLDGKQITFSLSDYGEILLDRGDFEGAETLFRELCELKPKYWGATHWSVAGAKSMLGRSLVGQGRFAEAEPILTTACQALSSDAESKPSVTKKALSAIVKMYEEWEKTEPGVGHAAQAEQWRARMPPEK